MGGEPKPGPPPRSDAERKHQARKEGSLSRKEGRATYEGGERSEGSEVRKGRRKEGEK